MADIEKRSIEELVARYELEPESRDIYVEGEYDRHFINWILEENGLNQASVYTISTVEVSDGNVLASGLEANNKGRTIELAKALNQRLGAASNQFTYIVDQDFDLILQRRHSIPGLLATDYSCMEMYLFNERIMGKYISLVLNGFPYSPAQTLCILAQPLQELFLIRLVNYTLNYGLKAMPFNKCCKIEYDRIRFDRNEFVKRYLHKGNKYNDCDRFNKTAQQLRKLFCPDCRFQINGHDFIELFAWLIKALKERVAVDSEFVGRSLTACIEKEIVTREQLFVLLMARLQV